MLCLAYRPQNNISPTKLGSGVGIVAMQKPDVDSMGGKAPYAFYSGKHHSVRVKSAFVPKTSYISAIIPPPQSNAFWVVNSVYYHCLSKILLMHNFIISDMKMTSNR